jgi:acyl carrier protein
MTNQERILNIIAEVVSVPASQLSPALSSGELDAWDSLAHLRIMMMVEEEFGINVDMDAAGELQNVPEIAAYVQKRRAN